MILLDTTVLLYAVGTEHPLKQPCAALIAANNRRRLALRATVEVMQEFTHKASRHRPRAAAVIYARRYAALLELLRTSPEDLDLGLGLYQQHPRLGAFDAVFAGVALNRGAQALVSADKAFGVVPGLRWVDPAGPGLDRLLAG